MHSKPYQNELYFCLHKLLLFDWADGKFEQVQNEFQNKLNESKVLST